MILDPNDPTGFGLFSRYARSRASLVHSYRPNNEIVRKSIINIEEKKKRKPAKKDNFRKQQSRQQRQNRIIKQYVPPVGQYNILDKQRPKLVFSIVRNYQQQTKKKREAQITQRKSLQKRSFSLPERSEKSLQNKSQQISSNKENNEYIDEEQHQKQQKINCLVDMRKMTGRKQQIRVQTQLGNYDIMSAIGSVKPSITKRIIIRQPKASKSEKKYQTVYSTPNYDYDFTKFKPRLSGILNFSSAQGRQKMEKDKIYQYQHYQYDEYVWSNRSQLFPNTKTHLVNFEKQIIRFKSQPKVSL